MRTIDVNEYQQKEKGKSNVSFCVDALKGLSSNQKTISSKYLYDDEGSRLFQEITKLEEYYPTEKERKIFQEQKKDIVSCLKGSKIAVAELGAGDGHKTKLLIDEMLEQRKEVSFYPIDISKEALIQLGRNIAEKPGLHIKGVVGEYLAGLNYAREKSEEPLLVLFLGSNIGNFFPQIRAEFLRSLRSKLRVGDMALIGFDLKKDIKMLNKAYNDSQGVTAKFNLNLLRRINKELGGEFDLEKFTHHALYNPVLGAMESYLVSLEEQSVYVAEFDKTFFFDAFEPIHLEYSFKFSEKEIVRMAAHAGFKVVKNFGDGQGHYMDSLWQAKEEFGFYH